MHDTQLEEQLRGVLRAEGDAIPLTITPAELERRLAARRRATGGRRLSWVAAAITAIVVVSIVAAGNGWLKLPATGTEPSPSPSSITLTRIERSDGKLILEIEPAWSGTGAARTIEQQLTPTDWVVSIRIACAGVGTVAFEERDRTVTDQCDQSVDGSRTSSEPIVHRVPTSDGYLAVRFTIGAAVNYTILVETVPLPDRLPAMSAPGGIVDIDATSDSDRPTTGMPGTTRSLSVGVIPASPTQRLALICLGSGVLQYTLASAAEPASGTTGEVVCDGVPEFDAFGVDAREAHDLRIKTEVRTAWHVMASHDAAPSESPSGGPGTGRAPLGSSGQAILVRPIGDSSTTPDSLEVTLYDPADQTSKVIATIPGSVVPAGKWVSTDAKPIVSTTGWLAIPMRPGTSATDNRPAIVIVDLLDPTTTPQMIDGAFSGSWNGDDTLAFLAEDGSLRLYSPTTGNVVVNPIEDPAVSVATQKNGGSDPIWTTDANGRFVAQRDTGATTRYGAVEWGVVGADGSFSATTDLPPVFQRTGLERLAGVDAHAFQPTFLPTCEGGGNQLDAGCTMVEVDATGQPIATRVGAPDYAYLADFAWATNGRDAWLLFGDRVQGGSGATSDGGASLFLSRPDGSRDEYSRVQLGGGNFAILGVSQSTDGLPIVAIGSRNSWLRAFVAAQGGPLNAGSPGYSIGLDGTSWFAGWAGQQPDYDPD